MKSVKEIATVAVFTALLIGGQLALSAVSGVEIVTVLLLSFSFYFGARLGMLGATAFSLLRCFVFGFFPSVLILYLIYYNLFALVFGFIGNRFGKEADMKKLIVITFIAVLMTVLFSLLDDVITPLFYGYTADAAKAYFFASFYAMIPQSVCAVVTTVLLFPPLLGIYKRVKI